MCHMEADVVRQAEPQHVELLELRARVASTAGEAKAAIGEKERQIEKVAKLNRELTDDMSHFIDIFNMKEAQMKDEIKKLKADNKELMEEKGRLQSMHASTMKDQYSLLTLTVR